MESTVDLKSLQTRFGNEVTISVVENLQAADDKPERKYGTPHHSIDLDTKEPVEVFLMKQDSDKMLFKKPFETKDDLSDSLNRSNSDEAAAVACAQAIVYSGELFASLYKLRNEMDKSQMVSSSAGNEDNNVDMIDEVNMQKTEGGDGDVEMTKANENRKILTNLLTQQSHKVNSNPEAMTKYEQLMTVIKEMGCYIQPTCIGSRSAIERLKRLIAHARVLVRECLAELGEEESNRN